MLGTEWEGPGKVAARSPSSSQAGAWWGKHKGPGDGVSDVLASDWACCPACLWPADAVVTACADGTPQSWPDPTAPPDCLEVSEAWQHLIWCQAQEVFCAALVQGCFPHLLDARPPKEILLANIVISFSHPGSIQGRAGTSGDSGVTWPFLPSSFSFMLAQGP